MSGTGNCIVGLSGNLNIFTEILPKFQDLDTDVKYIKQGGVRYMKNLRLGNSSNGNLEIVENIS